MARPRAGAVSDPAPDPSTTPPADVAAPSAEQIGMQIVQEVNQSALDNRTVTQQMIALLQNSVQGGSS
jgi:hypothetical protein